MHKRVLSLLYPGSAFTGSPSNLQNTPEKFHEYSFTESRFPDLQIIVQCTDLFIFSQITQDICSSARRIFDGVAVATTRKFNVADGQINK